MAPAGGATRNDDDEDEDFVLDDDDEGDNDDEEAEDNCQEEAGEEEVNDDEESDGGDEEGDDDEEDGSDGQAASDNEQEAGDESTAENEAKAARKTQPKKRATSRKQTPGIFVKNSTHTHPTTRTQASLYLTTKTLPLDEQDLEDVKTLADASVSSKHITNFLNERIGCKITPQQTRNLICSIMGHGAAEARLKDLLQAIRQSDGSDVLVIQDQMDVTCGIVKQTKVQKLMFERWGDTITMDFTHGTNNLGYHLGSLVVTTATGRGFPVVDFICLNQRAPMLTTILGYFQEKNPGWRLISSIVIDKDFVEWRVLKTLLPDAKVLLCQFHAISYWKKVMQRAPYKVKLSERDELLNLMIKTLYSTTETGYDSSYAVLKQYCEDNKKQAFFSYFEKSWDSCRDMWANFARGKFFTAGNTTTNRIESNCNQVKMLLGHKTRIDKTIAGLVQHQIMITQQIGFVIAQLHSTSPVPKTIPMFLRTVATRLYPDIFEKVRKDSHHLPCRHLMHLAREGHGFKQLPAMAIHDRWSTYRTLEVKDVLTAAAEMLQPIVQMSKLRLPKVKLPNGIGAEPEQPLVMSADFYQELNAWKETIDIGLNRVNPDPQPSSKETAEDGKQEEDVSESVSDIVLDPVDAMGTMKLMDASESSLGAMNYGDFDSDESGLPTQRTNLSQLSQTRPPSDEKSHDGGAMSTSDKLPNLSKPDTESRVRQVDIVRVPKPPSRGKSRSTPKQLRQTTISLKADRLAVHKYPTELAVTLDQFLIWARNTSNLKYVMEMLLKYPVQLEDPI
ncbi:Zinc finger SWIM domain-containing protein 3 [Phytophthora cinnamomi]|uniref:Zinc finger SWIM domain-containing protein 3 n=2 Tax=Phytophthora cinnamomi TaxID=4785 RepID=UPI0035598D7D|nr:Zinc finger SWIM domain-containing protein 3 [Phytophthora cinnamomi]